MKKALITICLLLLLMETNSFFWRRRRRRRSPPSCSAVNCQVGSWTSWSACSHQCGTSGTQERTRQQTQAASCGGTCPYSLRETQACNRDSCQNGGTPHSSGCSCRTGYGGTCCEQGEPTVKYPEIYDVLCFVRKVLLSKRKDDICKIVRLDKRVLKKFSPNK